MTSSPSNPDEIPDQTGRTVVVTGANSGIGFAAARALARRGARVVLACRSEMRAKEAIARLTEEMPGSHPEFVQLDLADLSSVRDCAARLSDRYDRIDGLVHNAGVMFLPRTLTRDGFEMHFGVNHLGHFALAGRLLGRLLATPGARIVQVGSNLHWFGRIDLDDLQSTRSYWRWRVYANSKLANQLYLTELQNRLASHDSTLEAIGAHPGYAATDLLMKRDAGDQLSARERFVRLGNRLLARTAEQGALPTVLATAWPDARNGDYFGPTGLGQFWGAPGRVSIARRARDPKMAAALWNRSAELTGVDYAELGG